MRSPTRLVGIGALALWMFGASCGNVTPSGNDGAAGSTGSAGATGGAGTTGDAGTTGSAGASGDAGTTGSGGTGAGGEAGVSCDPSKILCKRLAPTCPAGQVPSVDGSCYGPCVNVESCTCAVPTACPEPDKYTCHLNTMRCGPYLR